MKNQICTIDQIDWQTDCWLWIHLNWVTVVNSDVETLLPTCSHSFLPCLPFHNVRLKKDFCQIWNQILQSRKGPKITFTFDIYHLHYTRWSISAAVEPFPISRLSPPSSLRPSDQNQRHGCKSDGLVNSLYKQLPISYCMSRENFLNQHWSIVILSPDIEASSIGFPVVRDKICLLCAPSFSNMSLFFVFVY